MFVFSVSVLCTLLLYGSAFCLLLLLNCDFVKNRNLASVGLTGTISPLIANLTALSNIYASNLFYFGLYNIRKYQNGPCIP
jgi:hypothetical protein